MLFFLHHVRMNRLRRRAYNSISLCFATLVFLCGARTAIAEPAFPLHTQGGAIVDRNGVRVHLNGVNWYGAESTDFVVAGLQAATLQSIVQQIKDLGFNVVRLPWSNQLYETDPVVGNYALAANPSLEGENALTILDQVIAVLTSAGIMVILDNHNSNAEWCCSTKDGNSLWYNNQYPQSSWIADWEGMVHRYQNNPSVIGADLRNEPRSPATWGGSLNTDWHAAAQLGGNAALSVNSSLLIFVEGINYATDLSGAATLPVQLNVANRLVYEAHNYGNDFSNLTGYSDFANRATSNWGYLATGNNPQPLWIGEFGTCNTADTCINSSTSSNNGYWFNMLTAYLQQYGIDWTYWPINGTHSTGGNSAYGSTETYGVLNASWNGTANARLTARLQSTMATAGPGITLVGPASSVNVAPGETGSTTVAIVPGNGFTGTVNLGCTVSGPSGTTDAPTCRVPPSESISGTAPANATVSITTTAAVSHTRQQNPWDIFTGGSRSVATGYVLLLAGSFARYRKIWLVPLIGFVAIFSLAGLTGCGGNSSSPGTTAGSYTVTITGTSTGIASSAAQISLTVQ